MNRSERDGIRAWQSLGLCLLASACGGGDVGGLGVPDKSQQLQAATLTAQTQPDCVAIQPFYWEIGDGSERLVGGGAPVDETAYQRDSVLLIASASKWWWGAYVAERRQGALSSADLKSLRMLSGYTQLNYASCLRLTPDRQAAETVSDCLNTGSNGQYVAANDGRFYYNGGHFQQQAVALGLGADTSSQLASEIGAVLGPELGIAYDSPQLAAGGKASAASYARFLQKLLRGELALSALLGSSPVCTNPADPHCSGAAYSPIPASESWHYSLGHWLEDDPQVGDGAYSSAGFFGFYPWISADRRHYGIVARYDSSLGAYSASVACGRLIRQAYETGQAP